MPDPTIVSIGGVSRIGSQNINGTAVLVTLSDGTVVPASIVIPLAANGAFQSSVQDAGGGGGGGGAVTVADGADATLGAKADAAASADTGTFSVVAILKRIVAKLTSVATNTGNIPAPGQALAAGSTPVVLPAAQVTALTPPSVAALATAAAQTTGNASLTAIDTNTAPSAIGTEGNLWNAASVAAGDVSAAILLPAQRHVSVFGHADAATRLALTRSLDGVNFYGVDLITIPSGGQDFSGDWVFPVGGTLQLVSESASTITATLQASA